MIHTEDLGKIDYQSAWDYQKKLQRGLIDGTGEETLLLCEHLPVITVGKSGKSDNILLSTEELKQKNVSLFEIERGGDVTYHGLGQIVGYPILNLNHYKRDVGWYLRKLEEIIIESLREFDIDAVRFPDRTGVWTRHTDDGRFLAERKIASIGVRLSRWCTMHGFSLNVMNCSEGFALINPCGFTDIRVTSIEEELIERQSMVPDAGSLIEKTKQALIHNFNKLLSVN